MASFQVVGKGEAARLALQRLTGIEPEVAYTATQARIQWTGANLAAMRGWVGRQFAPGQPPGDLDIALLPVATPYLTRLALPYAAGLLFAGILTGLALGGRRRYPRRG